MNKIDMVKAHFLKHGHLNSWDAIRLYRITRLAEYIRQLRSEGNDIETILHPNAKGNGTYAIYRMNGAAM